MSTEITLEQFDEFIAELEAFDWYYPFSDDHRTWASGVERERYLRTKSQTNAHLGAAWEVYCFWTKGCLGGGSAEEHKVQRDRRIQAVYSLLMARNEELRNQPVEKQAA